MNRDPMFPSFFSDEAWMLLGFFEVCFFRACRSQVFTQSAYLTERRGPK